MIVFKEYGIIKGTKAVCEYITLHLKGRVQSYSFFFPLDTFKQPTWLELTSLAQPKKK